MSPESMLLLAIVLFLVWYWLDAMRVKELARLAGRRRCKALGLTFLDDTVVMRQVRMRRNGRGQITLYRHYDFEFTSDSMLRSQGEVIMMGKRLVRVVLEAYPVPGSESGFDTGLNQPEERLH